MLLLRNVYVVLERDGWDSQSSRPPPNAPLAQVGGVSVWGAFGTLLLLRQFVFVHLFLNLFLNALSMGGP